MSGIRVPDAQYEAPTPTPEQAQVPMPRQPVANANMFGAAQAEAGEQAGQKVQGAVVDIAKDIIQQKAWAQTSQVFENRELMNQYADKLLNDTDTHMVTDPNGTERQVANGYLLRTGPDKVSPDLIKQQLQQYQNSLSPDGKGGGWLMEVAKMNSRYTDAPVSDAYGKVSTYNKDQNKREVAQTYRNAYSDSLLSSANQPNMAAALHYTQAPLQYMLANDQVSPKDHVDDQIKNGLYTLNHYAQSNIGKIPIDQLKQQVDDAQKAAPHIITDDVKAEVNRNIDLYNDAYQKQVKINQEHNQSDAVKKYADGIASEKYNASNSLAILADKNLPANVGQAYYNAVMNVSGQKIASINKGGTMNDKLPLTGKSLGIPLAGEKNKEAADTANYTLGIANALNTKDATDKLVSAITDDKLDKTQLEVYTRTLALVGQYAPTETEAGDGKTIDPKGAPLIAGLKTAAEYAKGKPGGTSLIKNYLDGVQAPNADPTAALTGAMRTHALQINPKLANIPEGGITATDKYGNRRMIFPDLHTEAIKKSSGGMNVPSSSSKSSAS